MKKKIVVIFTGGTISMRIDQKIKAAIPALDANEIMGLVSNISELADIEVVNYKSVPSPYITPQMMLELAGIVKNYIERENIDGVVITHGTDTLEETAYFLEINVKTEKPIVIMGSMRSASELGYDGPSNLSSAIRTAISEKAKNKGVMVVMNSDINAANEVLKTHTMSLDTFKSLEFGPLGIVDNEKVLFYRSSTHSTNHIPASTIEEKVHLLKVAAGMDGEIIDYFIQSGTKGIVIEGLGRGNVPPMMVASIKNAIKNDIKVILVSRCPMGRVSDTYGYEGGGKHLHDLGVIFARNLSGQKARIKLMLALAYNNDYDYIKAIFEDED